MFSLILNGSVAISEIDKRIKQQEKGWEMFFVLCYNILHNLLK